MYRASPTTARVGVLLAAAALSLAACSSTTPGATAAASAASQAPSASAAAAGLQLTVVQDAKLGAHLAGENGRALYVFAKDKNDASNCTAQCAAAWPPLEVAPGASATAGAGVTGTLGTIKRADDGKDQVTYNGAPLYYFSKDSAAGDVLGQGLNGVWFLAGPDTTAASGAVSGGVGESATGASPAASAAASPASSSGSGDGYNKSGGGYSSGGGASGASGAGAARMANFAFAPADVTIAVGQSVTWTNADSTEHTVVADNGSFHSSPVAPGATFTQKFTTAGTYTYHCSIHPSMTGTVTVTK